MTEDIERLLTGAASAADTIVATWDRESDETARPAPPMPRSTHRRRVGSPIAAAAAIAAVLLATLVIVRTDADHPDHAAAPPASSDDRAGSPGPSRATVPGGMTPPDRAVQVLRSALPIGTVEQIWLTDGSYAVAGQYLQKGRRVATVTVDVRPSAGRTVADPCVLRPGQQPGRDRAPAPEDRCTYFPQPTGPGVWFWEHGYAASRPWTNRHTVDWDVSYLRSDDVQVRVYVDNLIGNVDSAHPTYSTTRLTIAKTTLIALATSPRLLLTDRCTRNCVVPADPTEGSR